MTSCIEILNPFVEFRVGHIEYALIDSDGTISVVRQGWEEVMIPLMVEMICDSNPPTRCIENEVEQYVESSAGILTIKQMEWLAVAVRKYGIAKRPRSACEYKRIYNQRLLVGVNQRLENLRNGELRPDDLMIAGARAFLEGLRERNVTMYLA